MKKFPILLLLTACWSLAAAQERPQVPAAQKRNLRTEIIAADSTGELLAQLRNMPNIEIGKGITFRPKNDWFELTMRFRMQNLLALSFDDDFTLTKTEARVKRLRLRFDGYIYSPKLVYSVQLGFTSYDTEPLPESGRSKMSGISSAGMFSTSVTGRSSAENRQKNSAMPPPAPSST